MNKHLNDLQIEINQIVQAIYVSDDVNDVRQAVERLALDAEFTLLLIRKLVS